MLLLTDNDVIGAVRVFRRILESPEWVDMTVTLELEFIELKDIELPPDAPDVAVWQSSQEVGALLMTGNRSSGEGSLDQWFQGAHKLLIYCPLPFQNQFGHLIFLFLMCIRCPVSH
jgi:hypothetical protein